MVTWLPSSRDVVYANHEYTLVYSYYLLQGGICSDNEVMEAAFYNGTSSSPSLFSLVLALKQLEVEYDLLPHFSQCRKSEREAAGGGRSVRRLTNSIELPCTMYVEFYVNPESRALNSYRYLVPGTGTTCTDRSRRRVEPYCTVPEPHRWWADGREYSSVACCVCLWFGF